MSYGSRGDMQPFVALGTRLQEEGASVLLVTNIDHLEFVSSFGLAVVATAGSCHDDLQSPEFLRGIATGDFGPYFARQYRQNAARMPERTRKEREAVEAFAPDLLYATPLTYQSACRLSSALGVPMALGSLFPAEAPLSNLGVRPFRAPEHPTFIHWSPELTRLQPWQSASHKVTGFLVVGRQGDGRAEDSAFGRAETRRRLEAFLDAGEPPVYMGWGSMVVPPETVGLAVRALQRAGLRGVILGGWAGLDAAMLPEDLQTYAAERVLFVPSAPHEWLLPRCVATVHHGGAGTVAAALRAGVPTVVTPCGLDQGDNTRVVEASGCGVALPQIASVTPEALAAALQRCARDAAMRARCEAMAAALRSEDGLGAVVEELAGYLERQGRARAQARAGAAPQVAAWSPLAWAAARRAARSAA